MSMPRTDRGALDGRTEDRFFLEAVCDVKIRSALMLVLAERGNNARTMPRKLHRTRLRIHAKRSRALSGELLFAGGPLEDAMAFPLSHQEQNTSAMYAEIGWSQSS